MGGYLGRWRACTVPEAKTVNKLDEDDVQSSQRKVN
jgi:hypothetical protein